MNAQEVKHTIEPVFDAQSEILILGTMPSPKSREIGFYYGHPRNRFWTVMAALFDEPIPTSNQRRTDFLLRHHIALWDVLAKCEIVGASDASITNEEPNDLARILDLANIRTIFCTGTKSAELYHKLIEPKTGMSCIKLPSTSPANASWSLERLIGAYRPIKTYLTPEAIRTLPVKEVVALEQSIAAQGTSLAELMERAGLWLAYRAHALDANGPVVVLCGNGNNGGDGWVAARILQEWGHAVTIVSAKLAEDLRAEPARTAAFASVTALEPAILSSDETGGQSAVAMGNARILINPSITQLKAAMENATLIIDAILGTGFSGGTVKRPFSDWITIANEFGAHEDGGAHIIAADVPSGLSADTGNHAETTIRADETVTMIVNKPGLEKSKAQPFTGNVTVAPLAYLGNFPQSSN